MIVRAAAARLKGSTAAYDAEIAPQITALGLLALASCRTGPPREKAIGEAFVGPVSLNLRADLAARSTVSATVRHGERLEILERRRRFAKVRTGQGVEGWTDGRVLLTPPQMARLRQSAGLAAQLPSQGKANVFDLLNVHTDPNRQSPSFYQIREEEVVDVIGGKATPRVPYVPGKPDGYDPAVVPPNADQDDWNLVRLKDNRAGWVLARMVLMAIPDEVAQYAEGQRITSYFSLGQVKDLSRDKKQEQLRDHWLWTTVSTRYTPYHFDSLRVFIYNPWRHRYETSYIERNMKGYYPVVVHLPAAPGALPNFTVLAEDKEGNLQKRTYEFHGFRVRVASREPYDGPREALGLPLIAEESAPKPEPVPGFWESVKKRMPALGAVTHRSHPLCPAAETRKMPPMRLTLSALLLLCLPAHSAPLPIQATGYPWQAAARTTNPAFILVHLANADGTPKLDAELPQTSRTNPSGGVELKGAKWAFETLQIPQGYQANGVQVVPPQSVFDKGGQRLVPLPGQLRIVEITPAFQRAAATDPHAGLYYFKIMPLYGFPGGQKQQLPWVSGRYIFRIAYRDGANMGTALGELVIP